MRAVLRQILETGDVVGTDTSGRVVITLAVDAWLLNKLAAFDGEAEDLEARGGPLSPDSPAAAPIGRRAPLEVTAPASQIMSVKARYLGDIGL